MSGRVDDVAASSWYEEKQSAWLYRVLADVEGRPTLAELFTTLAHEADEQALLWATKVTAAGGALPEFTPTIRARVVASLARRFGVKPIRQVLAAMKVRGMSAYSGAHPGGHVMPATLAEVGKSHRGVGGGNLRAAVFGANDGLISNASLIMGIAGATSDSKMILLTGVAGLLAGALSMAPYAVGLIPLCGLYVFPIWSLVLKVFAYRAFHRTTGGKAAAGALLPLAVLMVLGTMLYAVVVIAVLALAPKGAGE